MPMSENTNNLITIHSFPNPIIHIDGDAFFTSIEQALKPELRGKPVVTGKERGIVACASYEAKALGVRRPMRLFDAKKILPRLICLPSDYETYSLYSKRMFAIMRRFTPVVEEFSIDEGFAELSGLRRVYRTGYPEIAWQIKQAIQKELGLTVSVGLSASKILAKLASKEKKPDGFTVVRGRDIHLFLQKMPLDQVCGFGPNITAFLQKNGIRTVLDYILKPEAWAQKRLGKIGVELWHELRGEAVYAVSQEEKRDYLSISKTKTFTPPSQDKNFVRAQLIRNVESAFIKLRRHKLRARSLSIYLRSQDFKSFGMEAELDRGTSSAMEAVAVVNQLFDKVFRPDTFYRLTGIVLSKIQGDDRALQYSLFDDVAKIKSLKAIDRTVDGLNELYGKHTLHLGTTLWLGKHRQHLTERGDLPDRKMRLLKGETFRQRLHIPMWRIPI